MNYILEIKAFYELLELNQLHTPAIALWHALMHIANKTGWQDNFTVAIPVLTIKTGLNKQAVLKARNELKEKGLIDFKSRNNQAASYSIKSLLQYEKYNCFKTAEDTAKDTTEDTANDTAEDTARDTVEDTINKHKPNQTKPNGNINSSERSDEGRNRPIFDIDSFEIKASEYLRENILSRIPHAKVPKDDKELQKWAVHIDRMKRLDGMTEEEIRELIKFATTDTFWQSNILSTSKLREKKDTLYAQMKADRNDRQKENSGGVDFSRLPKGARGLYEWMKMKEDEED